MAQKKPVIILSLDEWKSKEIKPLLEKMDAGRECHIVAVHEQGRARGTLAKEALHKHSKQVWALVIDDAMGFHEDSGTDIAIKALENRRGRYTDNLEAIVVTGAIVSASKRSLLENRESFEGRGKYLSSSQSLNQRVANHINERFLAAKEAGVFERMAEAERILSEKPESQEERVQRLQAKLAEKGPARFWAKDIHQMTQPENMRYEPDENFQAFLARTGIDLEKKERVEKDETRRWMEEEDKRGEKKGKTRSKDLPPER